jgi:hypothetical protein
MSVSSSGYLDTNQQPSAVIKDEMFLPLQIESLSNATFESGKY